MNTRRENDPETITLLLQKLCLKVTGLSDGNVLKTNLDMFYFELEWKNVCGGHLISSSGRT